MTENIVIALVSIAVAVVIAILVKIAISYEIVKKNLKSIIREDYPSFAERQKKIVDKAKAQLDKEQLYKESIKLAFERARMQDALIVSDVSYHELESDWTAWRLLKHDLSIMPLTRITPILTTEQAEKVREYEILKLSDMTDEESPELRREVETLRWDIRWRVEEVPARYEPKDLQQHDRISYPELHGALVPIEIRKEAQRMLSYNSQSVLEAAELRIGAE